MISTKYRIKKFEDEDLKPEETLADALSSYSSMEMPISKSVFGYFFIFISILLFFFVAKSFQLQIVDGKKFSFLADQNSSAGFQLSGLRGIIYDSNGQPLVENVPAFDLVAAHSYLPGHASDLDQEINSLAPIIRVKAEDLSQIFNDNQNKATFVVKKDLSKEEIIRIKTLAPAGIYVVANVRRHYLDGPATAHLLGYTAKVTPSDMNNDSFYSLNDRIGRLGLEAQYEDVLRGGHRQVDFNSKDYLASQDQAATGQNLVLNIDASVQNHLYQSLNSVFSAAGVRRGAAIVQNPKTGAVLGLVSMPAFDSNIFEDTSDTSNQNRVSRVLGSTDHPLLDRAISGRYSPGSTIKPLLALAGLKEGVVTPSTTVFANGSISVRSEVDPNVFYTFRDWKVHGLTDIRKAIADSVDVYFYALGGGYGNISGLGISRIVNYLQSLNANKPTGIDLPGEAAGFVPTPDWKKATKGEAWYVGDTYNVSIGQGDLLVTPAWINEYIGAIANGGDLMKPFIVREIRSSDDKTLETINPQVVEKIPFDQQTINIVREGMRQTVLSGTATMLKDLPVPVAAKTGTAQISSGLNSLFTVFGPYDNPDVVVTVLVENITQSQGLAIRVANDFLSWYFSKIPNN